MENSEGVLGLRMEGGVMPWAEVQKLYMPSATDKGDGWG